ncbi:hypothetical protein [Sinorhizobium saheli]|uniref:hypothetical protein n=1 Tax=Sinorhizobium saheli TaxID=36856 RepID=UPI0012966357|nr:hypothetical protein [Sinorhizobium saheli]MQW88961.1 hypothetical protein [Sinorhizobium saheli]
MLDDHDFLHVGAQSGDMPGLPGRFSEVDSSGCLVELLSNERASLPLDRRAVEFVLFSGNLAALLSQACAEIRTFWLAPWAKTCTMPP